MKCAIVLIAGALALTGCSRQGPLRPDASTSVPAAASEAAPNTNASAHTAAVSQLDFSVDLTVPAYPVCSLTPPAAGVLTGTGVLTVVIRTTVDQSGGTHIGTTIHGHGTATDATGGAWTWSDADLNNELFASGNTSSNSFDQTITEGFHVIGPNGQQIVVKGTFHITKVDGKTIVEIEKGNHSADEVCESGFVLTPR
jgi:predicted small lipoprotein YifL